MDTRERIKDFITATAKEDPDAAKAALHDVLTTKFSAKVNPEATPEVDPDATPEVDPDAAPADDAKTD